ncbi:MAG: YhcH/YjgK/YiaL family protein [Oscillospiraceae bacterium]|nr:YhcH/YjgK/YiaL family protein [Oscillospiraceae bacterium]
MLYDTLENLNQYTGLFDNLDTAIAYIEEHDLSSLPLGKTVIDGDNVFVNVMEAVPKPTEELNFETHSVYMDLQMDIEGLELFETALGDTEELTPYSAETDFALWRADTSCAGILGVGRFVVFLTEEPHKPTIAAAGCDKVKKCVFKIKR